MSLVRVEDLEGGVRRLTLDHPPANAENAALLRDLLAAARGAASDDAVRAVVLTGAGKFFCGGFDLTSAIPGEPLAILTGDFRDAHLALLEMPKPVVGALNGHAIAGGLILLLACDYRLGLEGEYKIGLNEVAIGASFPQVAFETARLRLPHARAAELMLGAALYPASQAIRLGVVDELLPAEKFEETILKRARRMAAFPKDAYAHTKLALHAETIARVRGETPAQAAATAAVWMSVESVAARDAQLAKLKR